MTGALTSTEAARRRRQAWQCFVAEVRNLLTSEVGGKARRTLAVLIVGLIAINALNVCNSYVGRDFMTAIEDRNRAAFLRQALLYLVVFAASTGVAVVYRFLEERLALLWRVWMMNRLTDAYVDRRLYYHLNVSGQVTNPDQRIADDVRTFTTATLSLVLIVLNSTIAIVSFSGVMWSISPLLFAVAVGYAALGSVLTVALGHPLVGLNYAQADKEANLRAELIHLRENAESVALLHREPQVRTRLLRHVEVLADNMRRIIAVNRNLGFFTTGYNYLIQIIPALIVGPLFIRGQVEFGVITQATMAFAHLLGAFSLIINQFQSISSYAAVLVRLSVMADVVEDVAATAPGVEVVEAAGSLRFERLTLRSAREGRVLTDALSATVTPGMRLLVRGANDTAQVALFRATAGTWPAGEGRIVRPPDGDILFLPERPYLPPGTLRELLAPPGRDRQVADAVLLATLRTLRLEDAVARAGGLDVERSWAETLSLDEQHLVSVARLLLAAPAFAFLDHLDRALDPDQVERVLTLLAERRIAYIAIGSDGERLEHFDAVLELENEGHWRWRAIDAARAAEGQT